LSQQVGSGTDQPGLTYGVTLTALISDALRRTLADPPPAEFRLDLPVTQGRRMPTVDINSNAALEEYLDRAEQRRPMS